MHRILRCSLVVIAAFAALLPIPGHADPGSSILEVRPLGGRQFEVMVFSAAMNRAIPVWVSHPDGPAPALYLLNAVDGGESGGPWTNRTDIAQFFADKPVNVIQPIGGRASYYTDWVADDPALGRNRWSTFLIDELPPLLENHFGMTGRNAVAGTSMSATSALNLAIEAPGKYQAVGSYSGCPRTSDPVSTAYVYSQLQPFGASASNMWGAPGNPAWAAHDPIVNADRLRGVALYISAGDGAAGVHDTLADPSIGGDAARLADRMLVGGTMESVVRGCTAALTDRLAAQGIPAQVVFRSGTHAWPYWQDDVHDSWPMFASALGV
ncbi:alpha/beta hydrolase family protein [Nocardia sp. NPDC052001]|uniref:alpha/beta hydrolase n=1 Tax=Nocardia sp. NPDC052001 TaxID=3154853 RepID=UPI003445CACB